MLGYVQIFKSELKVREYEIYTGYYCGICKSISKRYGQLPRMALSYDAAFLAVMLASLDDTPDEPTQEHCITHPIIKKRTVIRNRSVDYAADVMLLLAWYKLLDDANDEGKAYAKATMVLYKRIYKKLRASYPKLVDGMETRLAELSKLEKEKCASLDMAAEAFSKIMEVIFREGVRYVYSGIAGVNNAEAEPVDRTTSDSDDKESGSSPGCSSMADTLAKIGYHMGKWIYLIDAVDDIEENISSGAYNPLIYRFEYDSDRESPAEFRKRIEPDLNFNLYHYLAMLGNYADSLDIKKNKGIIDNVIYFGLNRKTEEIIKGETDESI